MAKKHLIFLFLLPLFIPATIFAATLSISPGSGSYEVGDRVTAKVVVGSSASINAISGTASFPTNLFAVESVLKTGSVLNFWVTEPSFSRNAGTVHFEGVALNGYQGNGGTVVTIILRALKAGTGSASLSGAQVLANDGQGTDVTSGLSGANYTIVEGAPKPIIEPKPKVVEPKVVEPEPVQKPTLTAPEIIATEKYGAPAISGTSKYPDSQVLLTFVAADGSKIFITGDSDKDGEFTLLVPNSLRHGSYRVSAIMVKDDGTHSGTSNEISVDVGSIVSDIGWEIWLLIALLILMIIYLIIRTHHHFKKGGKFRLKKVESIVHKSFDLLREDIKTSGSTKAVERAREAELKKDLQDAEDVISKEIKDIEKD